MKKEYYDDNCVSDIEERQEVIIPQGIDQYLQAHQQPHQQEITYLKISEPVWGAMWNAKTGEIDGGKFSVNQRLGYINIAQSTQIVQPDNNFTYTLTKHKANSGLIQNIEADKPLDLVESTLSGEVIMKILFDII